jgi:hypothetical protein
MTKFIDNIDNEDKKMFKGRLGDIFLYAWPHVTMRFTDNTLRLCVEDHYNITDEFLELKGRAMKEYYSFIQWYRAFQFQKKAEGR